LIENIECENVVLLGAFSTAKKAEDAREVRKLALAASQRPWLRDEERTWEIAEIELDFISDGGYVVA
jgi:hypothetical protein